MKENFKGLEAKHLIQESLIKEAAQAEAFPLKTIFIMISAMEKPYAIRKIEEIIADKRNNISDLIESFQEIEKSWQQNIHQDLRRRAFIAFFKRSDCPQRFIDVFGEEIFPKVKENEVVNN